MLNTLYQAVQNWFGSTRSIENPRLPLTNARLLEYLGYGSKTRSGVAVTTETALTHSPVWQATRVISGDVATLPLHLYRRLEQGKARAKDHPVSRLLRWHSGYSTANLFKSRMTARALLFGNAYALIQRSKGVPNRLKLVHPDDITPYETVTGDIAYKRWLTTPTGAMTEQLISKWDILHIQGLSCDELGGMGIVNYARNTIGRHLAAEYFQDDYFANGTQTSGFLKLDRPLNPEAMDRLRSEFSKAYSGNAKRFRVGVLEDGMDWISTGVSAADATLVELLALGPYDVARFFNLPPSKLGIMGLQTSSNTEEENQDYYRSCLVHWLTTWEMECWDKLLTEEEKTEGVGGVYPEFLVDSILRADALTRAQVYRLYTSMRVMNPNEVRERENMNPYYGGDVYENPYTTSGQYQDGGGDSPEPSEPPDEDNRLATQVLEDAALRVAARLKKAWKPGVDASRHRRAIVDILKLAAACNGFSAERLADDLLDAYTQIETAGEWPLYAETMRELINEHCNSQISAV